MGSLVEMVKHPDEVLALLKLKMVLMKMNLMRVAKGHPADSHLGFCYSILYNISARVSFLIQQFGSGLGDALCIVFLVLRALDTVEDDTSIPTDVKVPILIDFHKHIYDRDWHFSCGTERYRPLMDQFHHVSAAFLELDKGYQEVIVDITKMMGAGMAKFINKEIESIDDYDEYCHYVAGLVMLSASKLFHASGLEHLAPSHISNSVGVFIQKADIIQDYLEDINEIPKPLVFWPRQIWSKYVDKLEDFKYEENSENAVQCLNEMVTNALVHAEDCLRYSSVMQDHTILRWCVIPQIMAMGILALCYNNIQVFRSTIKLRRGFVAKIFDSTSTMADIYGAFFDFSCMLKDKIDKNDPHAHKTLSRIEGIQKICRDSGTLKKGKFYSPRSEPQYCQQILPVNFLHHLSMFAGKFSMQMAVVFIVVAVLVGRLYTNGP